MTHGRDPAARGPVSAALTRAVAAAAFVLLVKTFLLDTVSVVSGSMEPTIRGRPDAPEHVLIWKPAFAARPPTRFDVVLFRYPNNRAINYLKRLIGLPGEQIVILDGDLFVGSRDFLGEPADGVRTGDLRILRKPEATRRALFSRFRLIPEGDVPAFREAAFDRLFTASPEDRPRFRSADLRGLRVSAEARTTARFRRRITDYLFVGDAVDAEPAAGAGTGGNNLVPDVSIAVTATPESADGAVILRLDDVVPGRWFEARVPIGAGEAELTSSDGLRTTAPAALTHGAPTRLRLEKADGLVALLIDERPVAGFEPPVTLEPAARSASPGFGVEGATVIFSDPDVARDVFWLSEGQTRFFVPDGHYLFLGDHAAESADARLWRRTAVEVLADGETLEGDEQGAQPGGGRPPGRNPWRAGDDAFVFTTAAGGERRLSGEAEFRRLGSWPTPYVPAEALLGRAVAVMLPPAEARLLR